MAINVLVVDDSEIIRDMILKTMRLAQIPLGNVFEASNGQEALDVLEESWVDVVLADLNMPVMDGMQMIERIRASKDFPDLPVVVISSAGGEARVEKLKELGVLRYLRKPFTPEQVRDVIDDVAGRVVASEHRDVLEDAMSQVLERFAMMYGEATEAGDSDPVAEDLMQARVAFAGGANGALTLAAPRGLCLQFAANAMGIDANDERAAERSADALGEAVNMASGLIASALEARDETTLHPPAVSGMSADDWRELSAEPGTVMFSVEDHPLLASLTVRTSL